MSRIQNLKYLNIYNDLSEQLKNGKYREGDKLPTETHLAEEYNVSRPTVTRALNALKDEGLIHRITGSGSFVSNRANNIGLALNRLVGLIIPNLGKGSIFESICANIAELSSKENFSLLWGGSNHNNNIQDESESIVQLAKQYADHNVSAVFFTPLEQNPLYKDTNKKVLNILTEARIEVILLDSDTVAFPERSNFDLISLDHFQAGYLMTEIYLRNNCDRVDFIYRPKSANSMSLRLHGYMSALFDYGIPPQKEWIHIATPEKEEEIMKIIRDSGAHNLLCGNDETASTLMHTLNKLGIPVPEEVRVIGFDDAPYSKMLNPSLTTYRQPSQHIAEEAVRLLISRLRNPDLKPRTVRISGIPVIRKSSCYIN